MSTLFVLIGEHDDAPWAWALSSGVPHGEASTVEEKSDLANLKYTKLIAIIPGMQVTIRAHTLGALNDKQKRQAAGFSLEDELATSLANTHVALDPYSERLAIISKHTMAAIIDTFQGIGLAPDMIYADYDSFKAGLLSYQNRILSNQPGALGYAVEDNLVQHIAGKSQGSPQNIQSRELLEIIEHDLDTGHKPINLRQGEFIKRGSMGARPLRRTVLLAAAIAIAFCAINIGQGLAYKSKTDAANAEIIAIHKDIFPNTKLPSNPALSMLRAHSKNKNSADEPFIWLSSILAKSIENVDGVEIKSLKYDRNTHQLSLSILYSGFESVEKLKQTVRSNGGEFTESGTRQVENGLSGDAVLKGAKQ